MWNEAVVAYFAVARNRPAGTKEKQKHPAIRSPSRET
jgi:hypothetical protein